MPIAGNSHGQIVTFRSPVVRLGSVSSTPHLVPQPVSFDESQIPNSETAGDDTDSKAEVRPRTPHAKIRRTREDASMASHSLQLVAEEFRKIHEPKIQKLKGGYSANAMPVFNSWLKDIEICVKERKKGNKYGSSPISQRLHIRRCKRGGRILFGYKLYLEIP